MTVLPNGFRVFTEKRKGETASVGVFIKAGSRNETKENNGVAHFLEHMYFKGTPSRSGEQLEVEYEVSGAQLNAHTAREYTCFTSHCLQNDVSRSVDSLADILLNPLIKNEHIEAERQTILREQQDVEQNIEEVLFDRLHESAYELSSLGRTILGPKENIKSLTRDQMLKFRHENYTGPNMSLVGVGDINHQDFVNLAKKYFSLLSSTTPQVEKTQYLGSELKLWDDNIPLLYQAIGFQGPSIHSPDILTVNIIQILLGSWDMAMGAGKHISSNLCSFVADSGIARSVSAFNHAYSDTGLFGVQTVCEPDEHKTEQLNLEVMGQMTKLCYKVREDDLIRAKNVLKNQILGNYEGRLDNVCEEIGKQILFYGRRPTLSEMFARIDNISVEQVQKVAQKYIYDQDPVAVSVGSCLWAVDYSWLRSMTYYWRK